MFALQAERSLRHPEHRHMLYRLCRPVLLFLLLWPLSTAVVKAQTIPETGIDDEIPFTLEQAKARCESFSETITRLSNDYYYANDAGKEEVRDQFTDYLVAQADMVYFGRASILRYARQMTLVQRQQYIRYFQSEFFPKLMKRFTVLPIGSLEFIEVLPLPERRSPTFNVVYHFYLYGDNFESEPDFRARQLPPEIVRQETLVAQLRYDQKTEVASFIDLTFSSISLSTLLADSVTARVEELGLEVFLNGFINGEVEIIDVS